MIIHPWLKPKNTSYEVFEEMTQRSFVITDDCVCVCAHMDGFPPEQISLDKVGNMVKVQIIHTFGRWLCQCVFSPGIKPIILVSTNWASDVGITNK